MACLIFMMTNWVACFQVLGGLFVGRMKFADMQQEFHKMCKEHEETDCAAAKYKEDLFNFRDELKEANEMVRCRNDSIIIVEKEREHARSERDKAKAELEKAQRVLRENKKVLANVV